MLGHILANDIHSDGTRAARRHVKVTVWRSNTESSKAPTIPTEPDPDASVTYVYAGHSILGEDPAVYTKFHLTNLSFSG